MADLDNTSKRRSSVQVMMPFSIAPPSPTLVLGDIDQADRQHIAWSYSGILAAGAAAATNVIPLYQQIGLSPMIFYGLRV